MNLGKIFCFERIGFDTKLSYLFRYKKIKTHLINGTLNFSQLSFRWRVSNYELDLIGLSVPTTVTRLSRRNQRRYNNGVSQRRTRTKEFRGLEADQTRLGHSEGVWAIRIGASSAVHSYITALDPSGRNMHDPNKKENEKSKINARYHNNNFSH